MRKMRIDKSSLILDKTGKSVLVKEFSKNYSGVSDLNSPKSIMQVMNDIFHLSDQAEEYVYLLTMNQKGKPICFFEISHGTVNCSVVGIREILIRALLCGAVNIVIIHNHPSRIPTPSKEDFEATNRLKEASKIIGITFCDHIIVSRGGYFSFFENQHL